MKKCRKCEVEKPLDMFYTKTAAKDGKNSWCKDCSNIAASEYYKKNPEIHKEQNKIYSKKCKEKNLVIVKAITNLTCSDCGYTHTTTAPFDWHHLGGKDINVSQLMNNCNTNKLLHEISKCVFLCACCHRIEHERLRKEANG